MLLPPARLPVPVRITFEVPAVIEPLLAVSVAAMVVVEVLKSKATPVLLKVRLLNVGVPEMVCVPELAFRVTVFPETA